MRIGAILVAAGLLTAGCPSFEVDEIQLVEDSVTSEGFTVAAIVTVTEEDPDVSEEGDLSGGRGILGVWLPPGWAVDEARVKGPDDDTPAALQPLDNADGHFPPTFPFTPGAWFAFASDCQNIPEGVFEYDIEVDVSGDGSADQVVMGLSTARFDDGGSQGPVPTEVMVDLTAGTVSVREAPAAAAPSGLEECPSIPYQDAASGEGCTCAAAGSGSTGGPLLKILLATFPWK